MTRVLIVAQSPVVRAGLEALLNGTGGVEVIGSVTTIAEYSGEDPDVILADSQNENDPARELTDNAPSAPLVIFADDTGFAAETFRSGVRAVLPRQAAASQIVAALEAVVAGFVLLHPRDLDGLLISPRPVVIDDPLTPREIEVLGMLAEGQSNKAIAHRMNISEHTVKFHVTSILGKLNAASRTEAVTLGIRQGLIML